MSTTTGIAAQQPVEPDDSLSAVAPAESMRRGGTLLKIYTWVIICWLSLPIVVMIVFGFNDTTSRFNFVWQGFTLKWYRELFDIPQLTDALVTSLEVAVIATLLSVVLGTAIGYAMGKYRFRGKGILSLVVFANIAAPEIAMGTGLLSLFLTLGVPRGFWTIVVAHVMFCLVFVAVTVQARMAGNDPSLEEAGRDLGASAFTTFRLVTLPLLMPGIVAGALLAFALSIDDFIVTEFNAGRTLTFPLWVYGSSRVGTPPQVNVMGTLIFAFGVLLVLLNTWWLRRSRRR